MTINELIAHTSLPPGGHAYLRIRDRVWANPEAYARISVLRLNDGETKYLGPWLHLFDRQTQEAIGEPTPQILCLPVNRGLIDLDADAELYSGPRDPKDDDGYAIR